MALMQLARMPEKPWHYCMRSFRNRAMNHRRSLWRRLTREWEAKRWFDRSPGETPAERAAMACLAQLPVEQREVIVLKIWQDCTFEEIGGLLEISPNTAAGRYRAVLTDPAGAGRAVLLSLVLYTILWAVYATIAKGSQGLPHSAATCCSWYTRNAMASCAGPRGACRMLRCHAAARVARCDKPHALRAQKKPSRTTNG